jgi:signal transduction histidine kinase
VRELFRAAWNEPAPPNPPPRGWRDWTLAAVALALVVLETIVRHRFAASVFAAVLVPTLLFRRTHPLAMLAISFVVGSAEAIAGIQGSYASAYILLLPYALFRWASGRAAIAGLVLMLGDLGFEYAIGSATVTDAAGASIVLTAATALGIAARFRTRAKERELDRARSVERERLARDLHDTVAHHMSAIAVRAQAGLLTAQTKPEAATEALRVIEAEASRALAEMRAIVRVLRQDEREPRLADLIGLAGGAGPLVDIEVSGDLNSVAPAVQTAIYHLARESVTNARRHARGATRIEVRVHTDSDSVHLTVSDDGSGSAETDVEGFGLVGMAERAGLVGGVCTAGPEPGRGWTVTAMLPRLGATA